MNTRSPYHGAFIALAVMLVLVVLTSHAAGAASSTVPNTVEAFGRHLTLNGHAVRSKLLGMVDLYSVALYLPDEMPRTALIGDKTLAKAIRLEVLYDGSIPDKIPESWRQELLPVLSEAAAARLRKTYASLNFGTVVLIRYAPQHGTELVVGNEVVISEGGPELMRAFLDIWMGQDPVSEDIREALLNGRQ